MKILHMHTKMVSGGIESMVCSLVNELVKNHDVTLCTIFKPSIEDVFYNLLSPNVKKITLCKQKFGFSIKEIFGVYSVIKKGRYDIVHIHGCFQYYFLAILLLHKRVKFVYTIHSDAKMENQLWDTRLFALKKYYFKNRFIVPVTISRASQNSFVDLYDCGSSLIFNGTSTPKIDNSIKLLDQYRLTQNTKIFINPGRISLAKNQIILCKVFNKLIKEDRDVVLLIAGLNEDKTIFDKMVPYFSNRIVYLGEIKDIPNVMNQCDGFCLPSLWEGLPITLLEALSVGCVPICSPVGGIVDLLINGFNGFLSNSPDENDYYNSMISFLECPKETIKSIKVNAKSTFTDFKISTSAKHYEELYINLLS